MVSPRSIQHSACHVGEFRTAAGIKALRQPKNKWKREVRSFARRPLSGIVYKLRQQVITTRSFFARSTRDSGYVVRVFRVFVALCRHLRSPSPPACVSTVGRANETRFRRSDPFPVGVSARYHRPARPQHGSRNALSESSRFATLLSRVLRARYVAHAAVIAPDCRSDTMSRRRSTCGCSCETGTS